MIRFLFALILYFSCQFASAERVTVLPEDGNWNYVSLMGMPGEARYEELKVLLPKSVAGVAHVSVLPADKAMYTDRYAKTVPALPCVRVLTPDGTVVYQSSGPNIPANTVVIAKIKDCCPRPKPNPPDQKPEPPFRPDINVVVDTPQKDTDKNDFNVGLAIALSAAAAGATGWREWRRRYS